MITAPHAGTARASGGRSLYNAMYVVVGEPMAGREVGIVADGGARKHQEAAGDTEEHHAGRLTLADQIVVELGLSVTDETSGTCG